MHAGMANIVQNHILQEHKILIENHQRELSN